MIKSPIKLGVFLSGGGSTLQNLIDRIAGGSLNARIEFVLSSRADAYGLVRAQAAGIPTIVIPSQKYRRDWEAFSSAIDQAIEGYQIDLLIMAGFMCLYWIPERLEGKVMNVHPSLIPMFCGKDMFGHHVHEAALARGVKFTGCTVHFVDNEYDRGPIILQKVVPVLPDDTPETLADRVQAAEREAYPEAIRLFAEGRLKIARGCVEVLGGDNAENTRKKK